MVLCGWRETILVNALALGHKYGTSTSVSGVFAIIASVSQKSIGQVFIKIYSNFWTNHLDEKSHPIVVF